MSCCSAITQFLIFTYPVNVILLAPLYTYFFLSIFYCRSFWPSMAVLCRVSSRIIYTFINLQKLDAVVVPGLGKPGQCQGKILINCAYRKHGCDIVAPPHVLPAWVTWQLWNHQWLYRCQMIANICFLKSTNSVCIINLLMKVNKLSVSTQYQICIILVLTFILCR